ncbi:hypothetical protein NG796_18035 [Laspinema sp. A4]|uniref:hypothetical protein n=1 Tax=Laspinema sp. D2d TaxID=2953686 RepID=UPI0021BB2F07|nr:hypothetical protein [Laspinema sp. D2d]MCT7985176.1 hypothetical protein [Laspinema sp. D2d]
MVEIYLKSKSTSGPLPLARGGLGWGPREVRSHLNRNGYMKSSRRDAIATLRRMGFL